MSNFKNATLLITGGTGSFGNTVLKALIGKDLKEIRIFSRDEKKQEDMRIEFQNPKLKFYIGDVRDLDSVRSVMRGVDYIFHAAALKQVPSCEFFPIEATKTNVIGTYNVIQSAIEHGVKKVVCLSTDKAAYPINAMGICKALMEKVAIAEARNITANGPIICVTRYGNVMASRGSVIPLFIKQIKTNQSLTITDPEMTRFMMSLDEAVDLVLFAFEKGEQGDLFVQKSPACTVKDLAFSLKEMFRSDVPIKIIGYRHGEKKYETLLTKEEFSKAEDLGDYFRVKSDRRDLNYHKYLDLATGKINLDSEYNSDNTYRLSCDEIIAKLKSLTYVQEINEMNNEI